MHAMHELHVMQSIELLRNELKGKDIVELIASGEGEACISCVNFNSLPIIGLLLCYHMLN